MIGSPAKICVGGAACFTLVLLMAGTQGKNTPSPPGIRFRDAAHQAGVEFVHQNDPTPEKYMIESVPGGVAAFDYNGDGLADLYFTNGASIPSLRKSEAKYFNRLYRNDGGMKFSDVTADAGVGGTGYSTGVATADYDNDGYADLFVTGVNQNILYHNDGNGRFHDVSDTAGIRRGMWSVAAGWFDYDNDGLLDLFVVNYLKWAPDLERFCGKPSIGLRIYCSPTYFQGLPNTLYHNLGHGRFEDVSERAGILRHTGKGMSVAFADYDGDGWMDAFVTNDTEPNFLFHNKGNGTFEEVGLTAGVAFDNSGKAVSSMGVDFRDYDDDGLPDLVITALNNQTFPIFRNSGNGSFDDAGHISGLRRLSVSMSGWCAAFVDLNNDGSKDIFTANSHVNDEAERVESARYKQPNSIFVNLGNGRFGDVSAAAGPDFQTARAHRGCAVADFNADGKLDVAVSALQEPAEIWENISPGPAHWLTVRLRGTRSNRDGIGARIRIGRQTNHMTTSVGYASSSNDGVHFGLGTANLVPVLTVHWPSGKTQVLRNIRADQVLSIAEEP